MNLKITPRLFNAILSFLLLVQFSCIHAQKPNFRKYFIIAYERTGVFTQSEIATPELKSDLIRILENKQIRTEDSLYINPLGVENKSELFFDQDKDEIVFFEFGIPKDGMDGLNSRSLIDLNKPDFLFKENLIHDFENSLLVDSKLRWTTFKNNHRTIDEFVTESFMHPHGLQNFGEGISLSRYVYPLILDKVDKNSYAEEYILISLSDFLSGSIGNNDDFLRILDTYKVPYDKTGVPFRVDNRVKVLENYIRNMNYSFFKIDLFNIRISNQKAEFRSKLPSRLGIMCSKIIPKVGNEQPEDLAIFLDSDLKLHQKGYESTIFDISKTKIKFTHNKNLVPSELRLTISGPISIGNKLFFDGVIATSDEKGKWTSKYTDEKDLMSFDSSQLTYYIPNIEIQLDSAINKKDFGIVTFQYKFKTKYRDANTHSLNFIYTAERALPIENIDYSTKATIIMMYYFLPLLSILLLILFLITYGKPQKISFRIDGYLDSFEKIDYKTDGKLLTPFKAWNNELQSGVDLLLVNGKIDFKSPSFPFNWNSTVYLQLTVGKIPVGFEMFLKQDLQDHKEFGVGTPTTIKKGKNNKLSFAVGIRQTDVTKTIIDPELVKFSVEAVIKDSILFIKSEQRDTVEYKFHLGADLRDVWVGFDPGTSGSCVAVGSSTDNIILGEDRAKNKIIPSILVFEKAENFHPNGAEIPEKLYKHGSVAETFYGNNKFKGFQSLKKLLGFKDDKKVKFDNNNILSLKGKDLAGLLVKGLFKDINTYFNRPDFNAEDYKRDGKFNPLRAVVAIPNNFTTGKIQDMIDCIGKLNQFKEIRYVYEAEAVLFYYLSNYSQFSGGEESSDSETILVFDMGGATINATIVTANKTLINGRPKYEIDFLGKIGYGIGGDTIDYCIISFLLSFKHSELPQLSHINIFEKKIELSKLALDIKKQIIENYEKGNGFLITYANLELFIRERLGISVIIDHENGQLYKYFIKESGRFKLFEHPLFIKTIYNNVKDAVNEVVELSDSTHIDKIIFSGRSTSFPMVKETVEKQLNAKKSETKSIALNLEESKMAVAKGACWYGINKNSVRLNNLKTNAAFGFKKTQSADKTDVKFYELVGMGCNFDISNDGIDSFRGVEEITDDFAFDGSKVNFYQVMGKDADKILSEEQKHKFSKIATINLDQVTSKVAMKVNENDEVECVVILQSNRPLKERGVVADQEIDEANEEHYTWIVK